MTNRKMGSLLAGLLITQTNVSIAQEQPNSLQTWLNEFITPVHAEKTAGEKDLLVQTKLGSLKGVDTGDVNIFRGIRYAEAPVGDKRFAPPIAIPAWQGVKDATNFGHMCYQPGKGDFSEDCLFLNVWTPTVKAQNKLPVYVFIHGGGFTIGSGSQPLYEGSSLAKSGIVVVTLNYRLGTLGFLPSKAAQQKYGTTGNWGMLDMIEALKWVHNNIESFGGDPARVTIGGESAGSFAVSTLISSPKAKGLFNQAIMESGALPMVTAIAPATALSLHQAQSESAKYFSKFSLNDDASGFADLQQMSVDKIVATQLQYPQLRTPQVGVFWPIPDGYVYKSNPVNAIEKGNINQVKLLAGYNTDEGSLFIPPTTTEKDYNALVTSAFGRNAKEVLSRYPANGNHVISQMNKMVTLGFLRSGMYQYANSLSKNNDVYLYQFDFVDPMIKETGLGVIHGSEIRYVFHNFMNEINKHEDATQVAQYMRNYWVNFIKTGNPNDGDRLQEDSQWHHYSMSNQQELHIDQKPKMQPIKQAGDIEFINQKLQLQR